LTTSIFSFSLNTHRIGSSANPMAEQHLFIFIAVTLEVLVFILSVVALVAFRAKSLGKTIKYNYLIMAIILANFGKPLFLLMIVWDYPLSFIVVLNVFLLSSLVVSLKVFLNSRTLTALLIVFVSFAVQLGCRLMLHLYERGYIVFIV
jgi:hypothetical protein